MGAYTREPYPPTNLPESNGIRSPLPGGARNGARGEPVPRERTRIRPPRRKIGRAIPGSSSCSVSRPAPPRLAAEPGRDSRRSGCNGGSRNRPPGGPRAAPGPHRRAQGEARREREEGGDARRGAEARSSCSSRSRRARASSSRPRARSSRAASPPSRPERAAAAAAAAQSRQRCSRARACSSGSGASGTSASCSRRDDVPAFLDSIERLDSLARRDGRLLAPVPRSPRRACRTTSRASRRSRRRSTGSTRSSRQEETRVASLKTERERLLAREQSTVGLAAARGLGADRQGRRASSACSRRSRASPRARSRSGPRAASGRGRACSTGRRAARSSRRSAATGIPKFDAWTVSNGVAVAVPLGTPVRAVYAGKTVYAQWLAEYGNLVILDHGDGMLTLYAWLQAVSVKPGVPVAGGRRDRAWRATARAATSPACISRSGTGRRRAIRWPGCGRADAESVARIRKMSSEPALDPGVTIATMKSNRSRAAVRRRFALRPGVPAGRGRARRARAATRRRGRSRSSPRSSR